MDTRDSGCKLRGYFVFNGYRRDQKVYARKINHCLNKGYYLTHDHIILLGEKKVYVLACWFARDPVIRVLNPW